MSRRSAENPSRVGPLPYLAAMAATLLVVPGIGLLLYRSHASARVQQMLAEARRAGHPASAAELAQSYVVPSGQINTAPYWTSATAALLSRDFETSAAKLIPVTTGAHPIPPRGEPWDQQAAVEDHLARYADELQQMHDAAHLDGAARYSTDFSQGMAMSLPHVSALHRGSRLLALEARVRARAGDAPAVFESLHAIFRLAETLRDEPVLVSQLARCSCTTEGVAALGDVLAQVEFSDLDLAQLQSDLESPDFRAGLQRGLDGERVQGIVAIDREQIPNRKLGRVDRAAVSFTREEDIAFYLECMHRLQAASGKPWLVAQREIASAMERMEQEVQTSFRGDARFARAEYMLPNVEEALNRVLKTQARTRAAATALAIERYRRRHGALPSQVDDLAPEFLTAVPTVPFDDAPLRVLFSDDQTTVYSVGADGHDDGGNESEHRGEPDVTFNIRRSAKSLANGSQ